MTESSEAPQEGLKLSNEFLDDLFGDHEGYVYSPIKGDRWEQHFFEWPTEREALERHIDDYTNRDVYISPVLFTEKAIRPDTFKGTNFLWTEFDGAVPKEAIPPSLKVLSSVDGHEHWYWKLQSFVTDREYIERFTKNIAYAYGADLSVWDYQNVLRPPDTWNHKRNRPVTLLSKSDVSYSLTDFMAVPTAPTSESVSVTLGTLPPKEAILAKYKWQPDTLDLLGKVLTQDRSKALFRLACDAAETGCSNEEIYVLVEDRDRVWGKYVGRSDRQKQLENLISRARTKHAINVEITHTVPEVYRFGDFMKTDIKLRWVIEGLLPVAGSMVIFGTPGVGKSTFSLRLAVNICLGKEEFLVWPIKTKQRVLFVSLEMQHYELKEFFEDMAFDLETQEALQQNFFIWPIGTAYPLDTPDQQIEFLKYLDLHKIDLVIIDSLSLSMYGSVKDDDDVKRLNSFLNEDVRRDRKCGYIFIHHPRKQGFEKRELGQDDSFGSQYINANAQTIVILQQKSGSPRLVVSVEKSRMKFGAGSYELERTPDRGFKLAGATNAPVIINGETASEQPANAGSLGELFTI